ncbi:hypothetical protein JOF48_001744 [Arthrobacter stackebrandtii]|uniref:Alkaline shock response membrane anchor protein AmaP n=1 Tax=Arthrobacter stackebrandtii TaxID=272161 RepID=A0ABS4YVV6_9MICC|nr:hypothetical protein [Arthrobacter stackebrandtii]MBP2412945.1 hypothetical protein [Arthrobacter stackebrandtii]PYH01258.1 hypothetical protein CVV67_06710 [Arthrobacter stackebrandtii]
MTVFMQKVLRRETRSARSLLAVATAIVAALIAIYCVLELLLAGLGEPTWLVDPLTFARWVAELPGGVQPVLLVAAGVLLALVGAVFLGSGLLPGRRARHVIDDPRVAIVVEDEVIASGLARIARMAAGVTREQVMVTVSARAVQVSIRPTSGIRLSEEGIKDAVEAELASMLLDPAPTVTVKLADSGVIGV